jgi:F-type H+-transporting ATPase subunit delta
MPQTATKGTARETVFDVDVEKLARVYAQAVLDAAGDHQAQSAIAEELKSLVTEVLDKFPEFEQVLGSALVSEDEKLGMLDRVFGPRLSTTALSFLKVLATHHRLGLLRQVARSAAQMWETRSNRLPVEIRLACETSPALIEEMTSTLKRAFGADPVVQTTIDPKLIAGFVIRVGDKVYDASARTSLERARTTMIAHAVEAIQRRPEKFLDQAAI